MVVCAAIAYLVGAGVGLHLDIRMVITATVAVLIGCAVSALAGFTGPIETVFDTLALIVTLQAGYISIVVLNAFGMIGTKEMPAPARVTPPSASDSPSRR